MIIDARRTSEIPDRQYDVVIVGSGFAGLAIADRLRPHPVTVCIVESGGCHPEMRTQRLYRGELEGAAYYPLETSRYRLLGGGSNRWGGWCRPLDPIDFEAREWIPNSGWPITHDHLSPYFADTSTILRLRTPEFHLAEADAQAIGALPLDGGELEHAVFQFSPRGSLAEILGPALWSAPNVTTMLHSNVTEIVMHPGTDRVAAVKAQAFGSAPFLVRGRTFVLATGAVENPRLMLASSADRPSGIGNEHDQVGRHFMEHIHVPGGYLAGLGRTAGEAYDLRVRDGELSRTIITPTDSALRHHRIPSCSISLEHWKYSSFKSPYIDWSPRYTFGPVNLYRRIHQLNAGVADRMRSRVEAPWRAHLRWETARRARRARDGAEPKLAASEPMLSTYFRAEQSPEPGNRVALSSQRDELGVPLARLHWQVSDFDWDAIHRWMEVLGAEIEARWGGRVIRHPFNRREVLGGPHHMGTTRMSDSPRTGVVDRDCRVHTTDNLFVAGSSVFTTGGYANPTFTLVALALRLADHLLSAPLGS